MKMALRLTFLFAVTWVLGEYARGEAVPLGSGSYVSPDHRFAFQLSPAKYGYSAKIADLTSNKSDDSVLAVPETVESGGGTILNTIDREYSQPIDFQTAIYRVDWTRDSKTFAVIYHVADGSTVSLFILTATPGTKSIPRQRPCFRNALTSIPPNSPATRPRFIFAAPRISRLSSMKRPLRIRSGFRTEWKRTNHIVILASTFATLISTQSLRSLATSNCEWSLLPNFCARGLVGIIAARCIHVRNRGERLNLTFRKEAFAFSGRCDDVN